MRAFSTLVMLVAVATITGCSKDSTTGPDDDGNYTLEESQTIGSGGGAVETEDFSLTVPAGAFDGDYELKLYASSQDQPFDAIQVTRTFRLEGLPDQYAQPLRVSIAYEGSLEAEIFIAQGSMGYDALSGDSAMVYSLYAATDSSGYLVGELTSHAAGTNARRGGSWLAPSSAAAERGPLELLGIDGTRTRTTEHFKIRYPVHLIEVSIDDVASLLENDYQVVVDDIHLSYEERTWVWPIEVVVKVFPSEHSALGASLGREKDPPLLMVNQTLLSQGDFSKVRLHAGMRLLYLAMSTYGVLNSLDQAPYLSFTIAVAEWSEEKFTDSQNYQWPDSFPGREMAPFSGMWAGAGSNLSAIVTHGRGMSAMVKYLVEDPRFGEYGIRNTFEANFAGGTLLAGALLDNVNALVAEWWPEFFKSYVGGDVYPVDAAIFTQYSNLSGYWNIDEENDTLKVFSSADEGVGPYPDLSAKLFLIDLAYAAMDPALNMVLRVSAHLGSEPVTMVVFGMTDGSLEFWGRTTAQTDVFEIDGLRDHMDDGWEQILVVVVNSNFDPSLPAYPYFGETDIDLTVRVTEQEGPELPYNRCQVGGAVYGHIERVWGETTTDYYEQWTFSTPEVYPIGVEGSFLGNTFTGHYENGDAEGTIEITLDATQSVVTTVTWTETDAEGQVTEQFHFTGTDIPRIEPYLADMEYWVQGAETLEHISSLTYAYHDAAVDLHFTLLGYDCDENSLLSVMLWEE